MVAYTIPVGLWMEISEEWAMKKLILLITIFATFTLVKAQEFCFSEHVCAGPAILQPGTNTYFLLEQDGEIDFHDTGTNVSVRAIGFDLFYKTGPWKFGANIDTSAYTPVANDKSGTAASVGGFAQWEILRFDAGLIYGMFGTDGKAFKAGISFPTSIGDWLADLIPGF